MPKYLLLLISISFANLVYSNTPLSYNSSIKNNKLLSDSISPICTDSVAVKYVRVNIHFMLKADGTGNFNEIDDGKGNTQLNGYRRAERVIQIANEEVVKNAKMWLPAGNKTPVMPTRLQYVLTGVYFHRDDYYYGREFIVNPDYHVDPAHCYNYYFNYIKGKDLNGWGELGGNVASSSDYGAYVKYPDWIWAAASLFNHEIGHCLGLNHVWNADDGCDDTPLSTVFDNYGNRSQCWSQNPDTTHPCNRWENISNNVMDYNQWYPHAYTPCQIKKIHEHLNTYANNYVMSCNACPPPNAFFDVRGCFSATDTLPLYLIGEASVNENRYLIEICETVRQSSDVCIGNNYNSRWFGGQVANIDLKNFYKFENEKSYKIKLTVNHVSCNYPNMMTKYITMSGEGCNLIKN
jgi:hypothetical protein